MSNPASRPHHDRPEYSRELPDVVRSPKCLLFGCDDPRGVRDPRKADGALTCPKSRAHRPEGESLCGPYTRPFGKARGRVPSRLDPMFGSTTITPQLHSLAQSHAQVLARSLAESMTLPSLLETLRRVVASSVSAVAGAIIGDRRGLQRRRDESATERLAGDQRDDFGRFGGSTSVLPDHLECEGTDVGAAATRLDPEPIVVLGPGGTDAVRLYPVGTGLLRVTGSEPLKVDVGDPGPTRPSAWAARLRPHGYRVDGPREFLDRVLSIVPLRFDAVPVTDQQPLVVADSVTADVERTSDSSTPLPVRTSMALAQISAATEAWRRRVRAEATRAADCSTARVVRSSTATPRSSVASASSHELATRRSRRRMPRVRPGDGGTSSLFDSLVHANRGPISSR